MSAPHNHRERGQALIMIALSIVLLFAALGLVVDIGWAYFRRQAAHAAADAAVLAAAQAALDNGGTSFSCGSNSLTCASSDTTCANPPNSTPPLSTSDVGCLYAQANGFANGDASFGFARTNGARNSPQYTATGNTKTVSFTCGTSTPPPTVPGACVNYWFTIKSKEPLVQLFSGILGNTLLKATVRATAAVVGTGLGGCLYVLDPTASKSLFSNGGSDLESPCGIWVNSNASDAVFQTSGATINAGSAAISIVGGVKQTGHAVMTPAPTLGVASFSDPLASMATPSYSSTCNYTNFKMTNSGTLNPGTYCGGIDIDGSGTVSFNPGLYVMLGGGIKCAGSMNLSGTDVSFLLTGNGTYAYQGIAIHGSGSYKLAAPYNGPHESLLFIKDRTQPAAGGSTITGDSSMALTGIIYLPNESLTFTGGSGVNPAYTMIVVDTFKIAGGAYLNANYSGLGGCSPGPRTAHLIE